MIKQFSIFCVFIVLISSLKMNPFTLYNISLNETALLLKDTYWNLNCVSTDNPFLALPFSVIDELICSVVRNSATNPLKTSDLHLLLTTGRVKNFKLEDVSLLVDDLDYILKDLASSSDSLVSIKLKDVFCTHIIYRRNLKTNALECLLSASPKLEYVESCIEFSLHVLRNCVNLKKLVLNFPIKNKLCNFLEIDGHLIHHNSLRVLEVYEDIRHPLLYTEIAVILRYCTKLVEVNFDISKSLEYLHAEKSNGTLETKYNLQRCYLGSGYMDAENATVSRDAVYIASLTCPDLRELDVLVKDYSAIHALGDFNHLESLLIQWETVYGGDYQGILPLLENPGFGPKLKSLVIVNFSNVEFSSIGKKCPNLENLTVKFLSEMNYFPFTGLFGNLVNLHIEHINEGDCHYLTLIGLLSNAFNLKCLVIQPARMLSDSVLMEILKANSLKRVKELCVSNCALSILGLQKLASSLVALEFFQMSSSLVSLDEAESVIRIINPRIKLIA